MAKCPNCGSTLGCGCQKRTLANGTQGCVNCAGNNGVINKAPTALPRKQAPNVSVNGKAPSQLNVWGKDRYKTITKLTK